MEIKDLRILTVSVDLVEVVHLLGSFFLHIAPCFKSKELIYF